MAKYIIDGTEEFNTADEAGDYLIDYIDEDEYDNMLDDCFGDVNICGIDYSASQAFKSVDEIAYDCGFSDYQDGERTNLIDELEGMTDGDEENYYGCTVIFQEEEQDEEDIEMTCEDIE